MIGTRDTLPSRDLMADLLYFMTDTKTVHTHAHQVRTLRHQNRHNNAKWWIVSPIFAKNRSEKNLNGCIKPLDIKEMKRSLSNHENHFAKTIYI